MSGFCLESFHLTEALSDCAYCLVPRSRPSDDDSDPDENGEPISVYRTFTISSSVPLLGSHAWNPDYLDDCGRRVSDHIMMTTKDPKKRSADRLTLDVLLEMSPILNGQDVIRIAARHLLVSHLKAQRNVHQVFFPAHVAANNKYDGRIDRKWFDFPRLACLYVCQAICQIKDEYQLHDMLDERKIAEELESLYTSPDWKKIGFALYTMLFEDLVKDERSKIPFSAYLDNDRQAWARQLSEKVRQKQWIYTNLISPVVQGRRTDEEYNRDLNILFIKLHLLDPTTVMPTFDYLRKALPDLNLELVTTNYLGGPLEWSVIKTDVELAIQKPTYPDKQSRFSLNTVEVFYGVEVLEFIMNEAKNRHLWTGKHPNNRRTSEVHSRCVLM